MICGACAKIYDIREGIPVLVDLQHLPAHLAHQVKYFEHVISRRQEYRLFEWQKRYVQRFMKNTGARAGGLVIDCGTDSGYMAIECAKKGMLVIATDLNLKGLLELKKTVRRLSLDENILLVCCDSQFLPLRDDIADCFISNSVLEHLPMEDAAVAEITRVSVVSAQLMVTVPVKYHLLHPLFIPIHAVHDRLIGHLRRYNEKRLKDVFCDWELRGICYTGHFTKSLCTLINIFTGLIDENYIEEKDAMRMRAKYGSTNMVGFFKKR